jgi:hypothetical protein
MAATTMNMTITPTIKIDWITGEKWNFFYILLTFLFSRTTTTQFVSFQKSPSAELQLVV